MKKIKLICIPCAGGMSYTYLKWMRYLDPLIKLVPIELSGRGSRNDSPLYRNFNEAIDDVFNEVEPYLNGDYAIFGHSMGSNIAYELYYKIVEKWN